MKISLTIDDAPTISRVAEGVDEDPARMDTIRNALNEANIKDCVAFVIGSQIRGREKYLENWLQDGFELGNHTYSHCAASKVPCEKFIKDMEKCDQMVKRIGAYSSGKKKWFRFPFLDRGKNPSERLELSRRINDLGYQVAHASTDLFDHLYENQISDTQKKQDSLLANLIRNRYQEVAIKSIQASDKKITKIDKNIMQIAFCHFGEISSLQLPSILERLNRDGVQWASLSRANEDSFYQDFDFNYELTGLVTDNIKELKTNKMVKRFIKISRIEKAFSPKSVGPKWPYL